MTAAPPQERSRSPHRILTGPAGRTALGLAVVVAVGQDRSAPTGAGP